MPRIKMSFWERTALYIDWNIEEVKCRNCGSKLAVSYNWYPSYVSKRNYICKECGRKYNIALRRAKGIKPKKATGDNLYGVPQKLPNGRKNPAYEEAWRRAHGIGPRSHKYGVRAILPDGSKNPEYAVARRRAKGVKPRKKAGDNRFGVPRLLPNGKYNPKYDELLRRLNGVRPMQSKFGVHTTLPNGEKNPEYQKIRRRNLRLSILYHYSGTYPPECKDPFELHKTPFTIDAALHLDHIFNDGAKERKKLKTDYIYESVVKSGFPPGYQVLCANCNFLKELRNRRAKLSLKPVNILARRRRVKIRTIVIAHYSNGTMACNDPFHIHENPFTDLDCLTMDHLHGNGKQHKISIGYANLTGWLYVQHLKTKVWPEGYQVLCWNCQFIKRLKNGEIHLV